MVNLKRLVIFLEQCYLLEIIQIIIMILKLFLLLTVNKELQQLLYFFSALSDRFKLLNEPKLSSKIFEYIMTEDDDGNEVRVLEK